MKEILYVKVRKCTKDDKVECFQIAETFKAKVIDYGKDSVLMEFVQTGTKNDAVIKLMKEEFESIEVVRGIDQHDGKIEIHGRNKSKIKMYNKKTECTLEF